MAAAGDLKSALADHYEVEREIGAGGMATVYLANDRKHNRQVAIKILHAELAAVLGGERFLHEIRVTANLQHPHILGLIDSGLIGDDAGPLSGRPYYVMPFVEGESLRQRLSKEQQLPVAEAVRITTEVASAIDYAHRHGVIHRDIKPENILLHDGSAIVADFGIALAVTEAGGSRITQTGMSLGTPNYMSPEQAMGEKSITARTDIYSLGAVCYEMLSGEPPFTGPTVQAIMARVLTEEPRSLATQRRSVPPHVAAAVSQALEKVPADRFATAHEFADALNNPAFATTSGTAASHRAREVGTRPMLYTAATVAALVAAVHVVRNQLVFDSTEQLASPLPWTTRVAISPDGSLLAYVAGKPARLFVRRRDQLQGTPLIGSEEAVSPFFSPDGKRVGLMREHILQIMSLSGTAPILVADTLVGVAGGTWAPDGFIYADAEGNAPLLRVAAKAGAVPTWFTTLDSTAGEFDHLWPDVLPNGKGVIFIDAARPKSGQGGTYSMAVAEIPSGKHRVLTRGVMYARYVASGHLVYVTTNRTLMAVRFDQGSMTVTGDPVTLWEGMRLGVLGSADLAVSTTGTLVYGTGPGLSQNQLVWATRDGKLQPVDSTWVGAFFDPALSPDGTRVAVDVGVEDRLEVWIKRLDRGAAVRLTFEGSVSYAPRWTPDGNSVTYASNASAPMRLWTRPADGSAPARVQLASRVNAEYPTWSPDGKALVYVASSPDRNRRDIFWHRPGLDSTGMPLVASTFNEDSPAISPDGRWLAYVSDETQRLEVYVVPFPNVSQGKWVVSTHGGTEPLWSPRGDELFYVSASGNLVAVPVRTRPTFTPGPAVTLFPMPGEGTNITPQYALSPDGRRILLLRPVASAVPEKLIVVDNWFEELLARTRK